MFHILYVKHSNRANQNHNDGILPIAEIPVDEMYIPSLGVSQWKEEHFEEGDCYVATNLLGIPAFDVHPCLKMHNDYLKDKHYFQ